jgi:lipoprotein signal peptidase
MTYRTPASSVLARALIDDAATGAERRQRLTALGLVLAVVVVDQATKWWGWRHAPGTYINSGSTWLIARPVSGWFSGAVSGRFLDLGAVGLLSLSSFILVRRRRRVLVLVTGFLIIGGWISNLLDRLGMHTVTAPGSARGAVDFIHLGTPYLNVADFIIIGATTVLVVTSCAVAGGKARGAAASRPVAPMTLRRPRVPVRVCAAVIGLMVTVVLSVARPIGTANDPWVESSPRPWAEAGTHG